MTTKNKQTLSGQHANRNNVLTIVSLLIAICSLVLSLFALQYMNSNQEADAFNVKTLQSKQTRYAFCHDQQIAPCTDSAIKTWNQQNPEDAFRG